MKFFVLIFMLFPIVESIVMLPIMFGPNSPTLAFKGKITENGRPTPAYVSLEVLYKLNGELVPISLVQVNSLADYEIRLSGLIFRDQNITNTAILRVQSLSALGASTSRKIQLKDNKILYEQNIELATNSRRQDRYIEYEDDYAY